MSEPKLNDATALLRLVNNMAARLDALHQAIAVQQKMIDRLATAVHGHQKALELLELPVDRGEIQ